MFKIYGKQGCSFCDKAESLLTKVGLDYVVLDAKEHINTNPFLKELKDNGKLLKNVLGGITVPIITYIKDYSPSYPSTEVGVESYVGGYLELLDYTIEDL